ncbi:MAG: hypothetical protein FWH53_00330 [Leptospirales bacterium]|nr:hypothetical protein [Leptospirales bacterium]
MNRFFVGLITGIVITVVIFLFYINKNPHPLDDVKVTQVSGEKITHSDFNYTEKNRISFTTQADGKGEIHTEIPKSNIPEAHAWITKNHGVLFDVLLVDQRMYSISYFHRWGSLSFGAGPVFSEKKVEGVKIGGQYWW